MESTNTTQITKQIANLTASLFGHTTTRIDKNGDILIDILHTGTPDAPLETTTLRIKVTAE